MKLVFTEKIEETEEIEETEDAEGRSFQALTGREPFIKMVPKTKGTYPNELTWDKKSLSSFQFLDLIKPTAQEVLETVRTLHDPQIQAQLSQILLSNSEWLEELLQK